MIGIQKDQIKEFCKSTELCARITDIRFDVDQIKQDVLSVCEQYKPVSKDRQSRYEALGLQYHDKNNPYYDCIESTRYIDENHVSKIESQSFSDFDQWNEAGEKLYHLAKPIYDLGHKLYRTRILVARDNYESLRHVDYDWRYHIPVQTNEQCYLEYDSRKVHLPADGHAYLINAGFMHKFVNWSTQPRYHYCGILSLPNTGDGLFLHSLQQGNKTPLDYLYT